MAIRRKSHPGISSAADSLKAVAPIRILLVEDNPGDARLVEELLADGCAGPASLVHEQTSASAMARLGSERFDLILLDMSMPDSQWLGAFEEIHARAPHVPVVVLTGIQDEILALRSIREGAQDYLVKGEVTPPQLGRAIRFAIERNRVSHYRAAMMEREHFDAAFEPMESGIVVTDGQWRITIANAAARRLLGGPATGPRGTSLIDMLSQFEVSTPPLELRANADRVSTFTLNAKGSPNVVYARLTRLFEAPGEFASAVLLLLDHPSDATA